MVAASDGSDGARPFAEIWAASGSFPQSSFIAIRLPEESKTMRTGSLITSSSPEDCSDAPNARSKTVSESVPVIIKPPINEFSPVPTMPRVERLRARGSTTGKAVFSR